MIDTIAIAIDCYRTCNKVEKNICNSNIDENIKYDFGITKCYRLYNAKRNHYLSVYIKQSRISIIGSLRKWHFGCDSLADFNTKELFFFACKKLAKALGINLPELMQMSLTRLDIGRNLVFAKGFSLEFFNVNELEYKKGNCKYSGESMYVNFQGKKIALYDKLDEMIKHKKENKSVANILQKHVTVIRAEFQLKRKSVIENELIEMLDLYDVYKKWNYLKRFWVEKFSTLKFDKSKNPYVMNPNEIKKVKDLSSFINAVGISTVGFNNLKALLLSCNNISSQSKSNFLTRLRGNMNLSFVKSSSEIVFKEKVKSVLK